MVVQLGQVGVIIFLHLTLPPGAALDAASRGLKVACVEQEDFGSGTSSRSTKLIWGGSRYLVEAFVALFNFDLRLLRNPMKTITKFKQDFQNGDELSS